MTGNDARLAAAAANFATDGTVESITRYGDGHINATYLVTTDTNRYILQRMNADVFPDTAGLMQHRAGDRIPRPTRAGDAHHHPHA